MAVNVDIVNGSYTWKITNYSSSKTYKSPIFNIANHLWEIDLMPCDYEAIGFMLNHKTISRTVTISYSITIKYQLHGVNNANDQQMDHTWVDPDDKVKFMQFGHADDKWGCEDIISLEELLDETRGLLVDGTIILHIAMKVFDCAEGANYLDTQLLELIEGDTSDRNLRALKSYVDNDVSNTIAAVTNSVDPDSAVGTRVGGSVRAGAEQSMQDRLISSRLSHSYSNKQVSKINSSYY